MNAAIPAVPRSGLVLFGILAAFALLATSWYLCQGQISSGDLYQHHAAGELWAAGETRGLYRDNILGGRIDAWQENRFPGQTLEPRTHFNYLYPPLCAVLASLVAGIPFGTWAWAWLLFSLASCAAAFGFSTRAFPDSLKNPLVPLAVLAFPPLHYALYIGQLTPLTWVIVAGSCWLLARNRPVLAGCAASLLFYKPQLLPWLLLFMWVAGSRRFVLGAVAGSVFWLAVGVALAGFQVHLDWLASLRDMAGGLQYTRPGVNLSLRGMLDHSIGGGTWTGGLALVAGLAALIGTALRHRRLAGTASPASALALGTAVCQVFSPYVCHYDYLLLLPWMMAAARPPNRQAPSAGPLFLLWLAGLLSISGLLWRWPYSGLLLLPWLAWTLRCPPRVAAPQ